jgi:hypothetical protein
MTTLNLKTTFKMTNTCYTVKLSSGETLLTGPMYVKEGMMFFLYPLKIIFTSMLLDDKIVTQYVPTLYQPFGDNKYIPIVASHVVSFLIASESDIRFYNNSLQKLVLDEARRLLTLDAIMNDIDYEDKLIMNPPEMVQ